LGRSGPPSILFQASEIPEMEAAYANELYRANQDAFTKAEALGWREPKLN
jgi:hypothetical protein